MQIVGGSKCRGLEGQDAQGWKRAIKPPFYNHSNHIYGKIYEDGLFTAGQASDVANLTKRAFIEIIGKYGVSIFSPVSFQLFEQAFRCVVSLIRQIKCVLKL
jgi:Uncharacterised protein family (UPF0175).